jgi:hypothetical protein
LLTRVNIIDALMARRLLQRARGKILRAMLA